MLRNFVQFLKAWTTDDCPSVNCTPGWPVYDRRKFDENTKKELKCSFSFRLKTEINCSSIQLDKAAKPP